MIDSNYEVYLANTADSKRIHFKIRYQVYCEDKHFESVSRFPDGQEKDEYDENDAVHFIVKHIPSQKWVAAMRLVRNERCELPIEGKCAIQADVDVKSQRALEISRMCIVKEHRGIRGRSVNIDNEDYNVHQVNTNVVAFKGRDHRVFRFNSGQQIMLALIRSVYQYGQSNQIPFGFALMTKAFARVLSFTGLNIRISGESCEYNGTRFPFLFDLVNVVKDIARMPSGLQRFFVHGLEYKLFSQHGNDMYLLPSAKYK